MNQAIINDQKSALTDEIKQMEELKRIVNNNLALLESNDVLIPVSHARAIPEITAWLRFTLDQVGDKLAQLEPKSDSASIGTEQLAEVIECEQVKEEVKG